MFKLNNELLVPAIIGLGLFAQNSELNLANNTSMLIILFLLLKEQGRCDDHHYDGGIVELRRGLGRGVRGARGHYAHDLIREIELAECECELLRKARRGRRDGCGCECDCGCNHHDHCGCGCEHHRHHHKQNFAEKIAKEIEHKLEPFEKRVLKELEKIEKCACGCNSTLI
ncbi:MAG: hypothetical protein FWE16_00670 [Firmicutes bacterium]|nr:hypothetical protein [Bacillota bacterium]